MIVEIFLIYIGFLIQQSFGKAMNIERYVLIFWNISTLSMFLSQMILLMLTIKQRFGALNHVLRTRTCLKVHQLKNISKIHLKLTEIIELMNQSYCFMAMFFIAGVFCMFNLFLFCVKTLIAYYSFELFSIFMSRVLLNFYSFILSAMMILLANLTTKEARRTTRILFELLHQMGDDSEWNSMTQNFVQQIAFSQTKFSCGLFNFDWSLCFKVNFGSKNIILCH